MNGAASPTSSVSHPLTGAYLKVGRARTHLAELRRESKIYTDGRPYRLEAAQEPDTGHLVVRLRAVMKPIPLRLGLVAGDVVHNLRSALDHLAWQLAVIGTGPSPQTQFPIFDHEADYRARAGSLLTGIAPQHRAAIEGLQPYQLRRVLTAGDAPPDPRNPLSRNMFLLAIGRLDNLDKHRMLVPLTAVVPFAKPVFRGVRFANGTYPGETLRVADGIELYRVTEWELLPGAREITVLTQPTYTILFGDPEFGPLGATNDVWSDRAKAAVSAADLGLACDAVEATLASFVADF